MKYAAMETWSPEQLEDYRLWDRWNAAGRNKQQLSPLLRRLDPLIETKMRPFQAVQLIPKSALKAEFQKHTIAALEKYDPSRGVPLSHHVMRQMDGAKRYVYNYQNVGRIPAHRARKVGEFKHRFTELQQQLGRPPTSHELSDNLKWSVPEVERMTSELRDDLLPWKGRGGESAFEMTPSREREVLDLIPYELSPQQHAVFEYVYGLGGKPTLGTGQIAETIGVSPSKISKIKAEIATKVQQYME